MIGSDEDGEARAEERDEMAGSRRARRGKEREQLRRQKGRS